MSNSNLFSFLCIGIVDFNRHLDEYELYIGGVVIFFIYLLKEDNLFWYLIDI